MVHDEQYGSPVLQKSRMQREVVLFPTQRRFFLFIEAVGPKGCTTRKPIFTKGRARTTHGRKLTERSAEPGERTDPRYELLSVRRRGVKRHGGKREKERKKMWGREDEEGKGGGMSRAGRDGVVDWQENEIAEERRNGRDFLLIHTPTPPRITGTLSSRSLVHIRNASNAARLTNLSFTALLQPHCSDKAMRRTQFFGKNPEEILFYLHKILEFLLIYYNYLLIRNFFFLIRIIKCLWI